MELSQQMSLVPVTLAKEKRCVMFDYVKRARLAVVGLAALALSGTRAHAQVFVSPFFQVRPGLSLAQAAFNISVLGQALQNVPPYLYGINPYPRVAIMNGGGYGSSYGSLYGTGYGSPYGSVSGGAPGMYGSPYASGANGYASSNGSSYDPSSSYQSASASAVQAQGDFMVKQQQAFKLYEQVRSDRIENRHRAFAQYLYERDKTPTPEETRQESLKQQVQRARNNPPVTEIWSGRALNDLLGDLQRCAAGKDSATLQADLLALDEDAIRHINVTRGPGSVGLLKNDGRLTWPVGLAGSDYQGSRERLDALVTKAVGQAQFNHQVDAQTLEELSTAIDALRTQLRNRGRELSASLYIEAKNFVNELGQAHTALRQKDVGHQFGGVCALKVSTVPELVKYMTDHGLQFASALPADRASYLALHQALANYAPSAQMQPKRGAPSPEVPKRAY
jgi:hypothetical protein